MMSKQDEILQKRLIELSKVAYHRNIVTYTDFLNLNELNLLQQIPRNSLFANYECFGGYDYAERQLVAFLPDALYCEKKYPYNILKIQPKSSKFAQKLNHRDYLGTIMGLGIERSKIGDILTHESFVYVFVHEAMTDYVMQSLFKVKNTIVQVDCVELDTVEMSLSFEEIFGTVSSIRLDSIIALGLNESRSKLIRLIEGGKVFVNGRIITTNAYKIQENDLISIRGFGKFQFVSIISKTKKDRFYVQLNKFV